MEDGEVAATATSVSALRPGQSTEHNWETARGAMHPLQTGSQSSKTEGLSASIEPIDSQLGHRRVCLLDWG